jgi:phospholipid/cholesterol/gamma-HCH transport system substrate-binding protein
MASRDPDAARRVRGSSQHRAGALNRVSTLTERLTELLSDRNQSSIAGILDNVEEMSRSLADRSPEIAATLAEARIRFARPVRRRNGSGAWQDSSDRLLNEQGRPLINDLRRTIRSAESSWRMSMRS